MRNARESDEHGWVRKWKPVSRIPTFGKFDCFCLVVRLWQRNERLFKNYTERTILLSSLLSFSFSLYRKFILNLFILFRTYPFHKIRLYIFTEMTKQILIIAIKRKSSNAELQLFRNWVLLKRRKTNKQNRQTNSHHKTPPQLSRGNMGWVLFGLITDAGPWGSLAKGDGDWQSLVLFFVYYNFASTLINTLLH